MNVLLPLASLVIVFEVWGVGALNGTIDYGVPVTSTPATYDFEFEGTLDIDLVVFTGPAFYVAHYDCDTGDTGRYTGTREAGSYSGRLDTHFVLTCMLGVGHEGPDPFVHELNGALFPFVDQASNDVTQRIHWEGEASGCDSSNSCIDENVSCNGSHEWLDQETAAVEMMCIYGSLT